MKTIILLLTFLVTIPMVVSAQKNSHSPRKSATCFPSKKIKSDDAQKAKTHDILPEKDSLKQLIELRQQIDDIDDQILRKIARRMQVSQEIGEYKRKNSMRVLQLNRWDEVLKEQ